MVNTLAMNVVCTLLNGKCIAKWQLYVAYALVAVHSDTIKA
jgi:hypothetical protein